MVAPDLGARAGTTANAEHERNLALFRVVHEVARHQAGHPVPAVLAALRRRVPAAPGLDDTELLRIAEEIHLGRDPSGL